MKDYSKLLEMMERIIHKYNQWESKKRTYGTDLPLTKAEIHTIAAVGDHPGLNITTLAEILGITKGAASQMIYKLVDKGTVAKKPSPDSDTEVVLSLTPDGVKNYEAHKAYHQETNDASLKLLKDMPEPLYDYMVNYFAEFERVIDEKIEEKR